MHLWVLSNLLGALLLLAQGQKGTESTRNCAQSSMSSRQNRKVGCGRHNVACCVMPCCSRGRMLLTAMLCPCSNRVCRDADHQQTRGDSTQQQIHGNDWAGSQSARLLPRFTCPCLVCITPKCPLCRARYNNALHCVLCALIATLAIIAFERKCACCSTQQKREPTVMRAYCSTHQASHTH